MRSHLGRKFIWTDTDIQFLKAYWPVMSNKELAQKLNIGITLVRMKCYELGLKRMELEYWTKKQINFLKKNYKTIGDTEMAELFNKKFPKKKNWTLKHVEKKRNYLHLHRTKKEIEAIKQRNVDNGRFLLCPVKRWLVTGVAKEGEIRMWRETGGRLVPRVKVNGKFIHWARWAYKKHHRIIPRGKNIVFKDNNPWNRTIKNLIALTDAELAKRNSTISSKGLSDRYVASMLASSGKAGKRDKNIIENILQFPSLITAKRTQLQLQRTIREKQQ